MAHLENIHVSVAYGVPGNVCLVPVELPPGSSIEDAIRASGILDEFPEIDLARNSVGIYNRVRALGDRVADGDRVEIYRPLKADAKEARRRRAGAGRDD